jgi:hypothetical protein
MEWVPGVFVLLENAFHILNLSLSVKYGKS